MTKFKEARHAAGLSVSQCAVLLSVHPVSVRRWEMDPGKATHKNAPELAYKVLRWFQDGAVPHL